MAGFEEQLNSILGNQEAMGQIMALARSLSGGQTPPVQEETPPALEGTGEDTYVPVEEAPPAPTPDLSALLGQVDPKMLQMGMEIFRQVQSTEDRNAALLNALRPFLREERKARLDRALQIARTAKLVRAAMGVLKGKGGGACIIVISRRTYLIPLWSRLRPLQDNPVRPGRRRDSDSRPSVCRTSSLERRVCPNFWGREGGGLSSLLRTFHLDQLDSGDILLLLIVLYLLVEGDDMELAIALGLVLFMGLGEENPAERPPC